MSRTTIVEEFRKRFVEPKLFWDTYHHGQFANYLLSRHETPDTRYTADTAHKLVEEANLFIDAAHKCHAKFRPSRPQAAPQRKSESMDVFKIAVKIFVAEDNFAADRFVPIFHRWIQNQAVEGHLLIDVADYAHVAGGPWVTHSFHMDLGLSSGANPRCPVRSAKPTWRRSRPPLCLTWIAALLDRLAASAPSR
jgi:hypothetical protein